MNLNGKFAFLTSSRFWAIVIASLSIYLKAKGFIGDPEMILISSIMGGFAVVRTVDRVSDKQVEVANIVASAPSNQPVSPSEAGVPTIN